jgi:hypothetical protein
VTNGKNKPTVREFWKSFNIRHAIDTTVEAWAEVSQSCMNRVWKKLLHFVHDFQHSELGEEMKKISTAKYCTG